AAIGGGKIKPHHLLAIDTGEVMHSQPVPGEATVDPSFGCPALWIEAGSRDLAVAEGYLVVDAESVIATQLSQLLAGRASDLLGPDQVRDLVDFLRGRHGQLIETITPQPLPLAALTRILKSLLLDGISLRHALRIFSSLSQAAQQTNEHDRLIDLIRADLGSMLVGDICAPDAKLPVITLAAQLEEMVVGGMQDPASGEIIIEPDLARSIGERIQAILQQRHPDAPRPALIVQPRARRALTGLLKLRAPGVLVLSINELPSAQPIEVIAVIGGESPEIPADQSGTDPTAYSPEMETLAA
ncbi:MAG: flagellar biosynthesis protein FlhA, partial [Erythrobacter sp.]|nr:flagellar biosynthesis protein FlhA [Erythrobacter sp.]